MTGPLPVLVSQSLVKFTSHCNTFERELEALRAENKRLEESLILVFKKEGAGSALSNGSNGFCNGGLPHQPWDAELADNGDSLETEHVPEPSREGREGQAMWWQTSAVKAAKPPPEKTKAIEDDTPSLQLIPDNGTSYAELARVMTANSISESRLLKRASSIATSVDEDRILESLAAARLGMITQEQNLDDGLDRVNNVFEAFQALEAIEDDGLDEDGVKVTPMSRFARSTFFRALSIIGIAANTVFIGVHADFTVKNSYRPLSGEVKNSDGGYHLAEVAFVIWFSFELVVRLLSEQLRFFKGKEQTWNIFDMVLVFNSLVELMLPDLLANMSFLRIFRVFRLVRVVRIVRTVPALKSLRTMVFALLNSFVCLLWAFVMIALIIFVFSVIFTGAVAETFQNANLQDEAALAAASELEEAFGSLYETQVSLFCSITGGNDWMTYAGLIRELHNGEIYFLCYGFYVAFCLIGMLNVVTGIFVDSAVCTRTQDEVVDNYLQDQAATSEEVRRIFKEADVDKSGTICYKELKDHLNDPWVRAYFAGLEIDPSEAQIIFSLIDIENKNEVTIDEFVDGTMKLKGHAKAIDILSLMFDHVRLQAKLNTLCNWIEDQIYEIKTVIVPGTERPEELFFDREFVFKNRSRLRRSSTTKCFDEPIPPKVPRVT
eukprot:TRINITY_DN18877_c0_g1_i1.p1 TRINITY_DN18877_c0_g1~~TRINITY_DN18877_c0_g1_i1.p1  ORF type:complete len:663 (-),score=168.59 TRINITY_DN18877_c0_g1_i1:169-2157(-)